MAELAMEERLRTLERRLQELEDDRAIRELLARYGYNADQGRSEAFVRLYTEDGVFSYPGDPSRRTSSAEDREAAQQNLMGVRPEDEAILSYHGRDELRAFICDPLGHKSIEGMSLHFQGNNLLTRIDGDRATAESYNFTLVRKGGEFVLLSACINLWTLAKKDGRWLIAACKRRRPGSQGFDDVHVTME